MLVLVTAGAPALRSAMGFLGQRNKNRHGRALADAQERYFSLTNNVPVGIFRSTIDGRYLSVNPAMVALLGYESESDLLETQPINLYIDGNARMELLDRLRADGTVNDFEIQLKRRNATPIWVSISARGISDKGHEMAYMDAIMFDITGQKKTLDSLHLIRERLSQVQEVAGLGYWFTDGYKGVTTWSEQLYQLLGLEPGIHDPSLENFFTAIHEEDRESLLIKHQESIISGKSQNTVFRVRHPNGKVVTVSGFTEISESPEGIFYPHFGTLQNISDAVAAQEEIKELNAQLEMRIDKRTSQLEDANKELEAFAYSVSHDLHAPLRSIDGFSIALEEDYRDSLDDAGRDYLNRIRQAANRMGALIDDLLTMSRVSRGEMDRVVCDISNMAEDILHDLAVKEPDRHVEWTIKENMTLFGDKSLMEQVLINLLSNAWKFTLVSDPPIIDIGTFAMEGATGIYVKDNGAGFNMDYAEHLFDPFRRLHDMDEFPGTGIGLSTVQRIIRRHGGTIRGEGEDGVGATFYFTIPAEAEEMVDG